jgi:hypothetical protein
MATEYTQAAGMGLSDDQSQDNILTAVERAETSETNAANSETNAAISEANAATSAAASATSATEASNSASNAATSETNAATSANEAANSIMNVAASAAVAATSATTATTQASNASTSASNASMSETNAANSATASASSAATASSEATTAANERAAAEAAELAASNHATEAEGYSIDALAYRNESDTSATNAATSESNAAASATAASNSAGVATLNATSAADSASSAANSATASANSATESATSATQSATSASNAATSASNAAASEAAAATSASAAITANPNLNLMTESEFQALAARRREQYAASGFVDFGEAYQNTSSITKVNEGINSRKDFPNYIGIPYADQTQVKDVPVVSVNGVLSRLRSVADDGLNRNDIDLPPAPTVTHADSTNSGLVKNGDFSLGGNGDWFKTNATISGNTITASNTGGIYTGAVLGLEIGKKYIVEINVSANISSELTVKNSDAALGADPTVLTVGTGAGQFKAEFTATKQGIYIRSANAATFTVESISVIEAASLSRQDLVFAEFWDEDISEKGNIVYPYGNVQYRGGNVDGLSGIADGSFTGKDTYSLFGNWQTANALVGKGYDWDLLSDAQKAIFAGNPEHNLRKDGDKIIQTRYRIRVVEGLGDEWTGIDANSISYLQYYNNNRTGCVIPKGKTVYQNSDIGSYLLNYHRFKGVNEIDGSPSGVFTSARHTVDADSSLAYKGRCYAMPIALVQR